MKSFMTKVVLWVEDNTLSTVLIGYSTLTTILVVMASFNI